jgi:hypothetical protein
MRERGNRGKVRRSRGLMLAVASLAAVTALAPVAADAKKKKKKGKPAVTRTAGVPFAQASNASSSATCPKGTHVSGGGFTVTPSFTPPSTGLLSVNSTSHATGNRTWTGAGSAYQAPTASGSFTAVARCTNNRRGGIAVRGDSQVSLQPAEARNLVFNCPAGTHVLNGGYAGQGLASFATQLSSARIVVNSAQAPSAATVTGYASCEQNRKGRSVSQVAAVAQITDDARASADATCSKKKFVIGGGFVITPLPPGNVPFAPVDESTPVGKRAWHVGVYAHPAYTMPPGSALQTIAYCKKA